MEDRVGFTFFESFKEAIEYLQDDEQLTMYKAITNYGLFGEEPELPRNLMAVFVVIKANIDKSNKRRENSKKNGKNGGAPSGNQNAKKAAIDELLNNYTYK